MSIVGQPVGLLTVETRKEAVLLSGEYLQVYKQLYIIVIII